MWNYIIHHSYLNLHIHHSYLSNHKEKFLERTRYYIEVINDIKLERLKHAMCRVTTLTLDMQMHVRSGI